MAVAKQHQCNRYDHDHDVEGPWAGEAAAAGTGAGGRGVPDAASAVQFAGADHGVGSVQGVGGVPGHDGRARLLRLSSRQGALVKVGSVPAL